MSFVPEGQHDRSLARSAWNCATQQVPSRRYDSCRCAAPIQRLEGGNFECAIAKQIEMIPKCIGGILEHVRLCDRLRVLVRSLFINDYWGWVSIMQRTDRDP